MTFFVIVSSLVLFSVVWDSTEEFRRKVRLNHEEFDL